MRSFGRILKRCFLLAAIVATALGQQADDSKVATRRIVLDAPGHVAVEGAAVSAQGGEPGAAWRLVDWRGRDAGLSGAFDDEGRATLPPLPAGYYRLLGESPIPNPESTISPSLATLAVVPSTCRDSPCGVAEGGAASFFAADCGASLVSLPGAFECPWNDGDTVRTVAELARLAGIRHVRERMRWREVQPSPDAPPDFSRYLACADLFKERGIALSGLFHDTPDWAGRLQKLPADLGALYRFCRDAASAFGDRMEDWEFWNEPDIEFAPEPVWDYAATLKAAYLGFKAARPDKPVLNGALCRPPASSYESVLFENDAAHYFDIFNYHTYSAPSQHAAIFAKLRESLGNAVQTRGLRPAFPIWVTECGTHNEGPATEESVRRGYKAHSPGQELVVAEYCAKANISLQMEGVARNYFFILGAYSERGGAKDWGMLRRDGTAKPVYAALATIARELGDATLLGALDAGPGIRAFLYEHPDGTQAVAFWAESALDAAPASTALVEAEPDSAREWVLHPPAPAGVAPFRLSDMCGMTSAVAPDATGSLALPATRFPSYLSGLRGLRASVPANGGFAAGAPAPAPSPIVFRVDLAPGDFEISGSKTLAVTKAEASHLRVQVWNLSDVEQTGTVEAAGAVLEGLPTTPLALAPFACTEFDCVLRAPDTSPSATLVLTGLFNGRRSTRLSMPVIFEPLLFAACETVPLDWRDPAAWQRNDSAATFSATWDEAEQAVRFDVSWDDPRVNRWFYPVLPLAPVLPSLNGAVRAVFEVKTAQDKVENDFMSGAGSNLMLVRRGGDGSSADWLPYPAPTGSWERRYVELSTADGGLDDVEAIRIGANPMGMRLTFWIRNVAVMRILL